MPTKTDLQMKAHNHSGRILKVLLSLTVVLLISNTLIAQSPDFEQRFQLLQGTWELDINKTLSSLKSESRAYYESLKEDKKASIRSSFGSRRVTFSPDGSYTIVSAIGQMTGDWELYGDGITLAIYFRSNGQTHEQQVISIGQSKMELGLHRGTTDGQLFDTWHMKRISNQN